MRLHPWSTGRPAAARAPAPVVLVGACAVSLVLPACSSWSTGRQDEQAGSVTSSGPVTAKSAGGPGPVDPGRGFVRTPVDEASAARVPVGGVAGHPLEVEVEPGDFAGQGTVDGRPSPRSQPQDLGFVAAGRAREVAVSGDLAGALTLSFSSGPGHADDLPMIWHHDGEAGWQLLAVAGPGATTRAEPASASAYVAGWLSVPAWLPDAAAAVVRSTGFRRSAPTCERPPPTWATLRSPTLDVVGTCATTRTGPDELVELRLKNNRGLVQEVAVPDAVRYVSVQGQDDAVHRLARTVAGGRDVVLLPPGGVLAVGIARPVRAGELHLEPAVTNLALASSLLSQLGSLTADPHAHRMVTELVALREVATAAPQVVTGRRVRDRGDVHALVTDVVASLAASMGEVQRARRLAPAVVAAESGVPPAQLRSDPATERKVRAAAARLHRLGLVFTALDPSEVARLADVVWEAVAEMIGRALVRPDPVTVTVRMAGSTGSADRSTSP